MGLFLEKVLHDLLHAGYPRRTSNEHHLSDLVRLQTSIIKGLFARAEGSLENVFDQLLKLGAGELHIQMLRSAGIRCDKRKVDIGLLSR